MYRIYDRTKKEKKEFPVPEDSLLDIVIQDFNFPFNIEIVFCLFGDLGNVLFDDPQLEGKLENEDKDRLNRRVAGKTFKDLNLCYVCFYNELTLTIKNLIHELHHFQDIFECSTGGEYINTKGYLEKLICTHLNDFYAEYYAIKRMIDLRYNDRIIGINLLSIISMNLRYLKNNEQYAKKEIKKKFEQVVSDFERPLMIIYYLQHYIIKLFLYFLANYRGFQERGFSNQLYENYCTIFISNEIRPPLAKLLNKIKQKIMDEDLDLIGQSSELKDFLNDEISNFYHNDLNEYLSELFEKRANYSPLSLLQELPLKLNSQVFEQIRNITHGINLEWMKHLQLLTKSFTESIAKPLSQMSKLINKFNISPKFGLNNHDDDLEQKESDDKGDSD